VITIFLSAKNGFLLMETLNSSSASDKSNNNHQSSAPTAASPQVFASQEVPRRGIELPKKKAQVEQASTMKTATNKKSQDSNRLPATRIFSMSARQLTNRLASSCFIKTTLICILQLVYACSTHATGQ